MKMEKNSMALGIKQKENSLCPQALLLIISEANLFIEGI
ncbi:hypothetical protein DET65_3785 [Sunxiuqinia elliptica]|uniref:Uncharacterized protein n=1 Tax=Sunxiuqinia elliptica TaxID=655355 RepID=A0A4V3BXT8_9BACT|nr:hypothetical protein DET52_106221 [Sunxiuqinia elliptica]TDO57200.1 hypothetical protein DET65_3785 [Sunxiuqinia elliptica]